MRSPGPFCAARPSASRCGFTAFARRALHGKRLAVWGDSILAQIFFAMACDLMRHGHLPQSAELVGGGLKTITLFAPALNLSLTMLEHLVVEATYCKKEKALREREMMQYPGGKQAWVRAGGQWHRPCLASA